MSITFRQILQIVKMSMIFFLGLTITIINIILWHHSAAQQNNYTKTVTVPYYP